MVIVFSKNSSASSKFSNLLWWDCLQYRFLKKYSLLRCKLHHVKSTMGWVLGNISSSPCPWQPPFYSLLLNWTLSFSSPIGLRELILDTNPLSAMWFTNLSPHSRLSFYLINGFTSFSEACKSMWSPLLTRFVTCAWVSCPKNGWDPCQGEFSLCFLLGIL